MKGSKSSSDAKGLGLTASIKGLAMAGAEENEVIPNGSSNPELALKVSLKFIKKIVSISFFMTQVITKIAIKGLDFQWCQYKYV